VLAINQIMEMKAKAVKLRIAVKRELIHQIVREALEEYN